MKKKIILLFLAITTFMIATSVHAASFSSYRIENIRTHKNNGVIEEFKVAYGFTENGTNNRAYCIEPFIFLDEEEIYSESDPYTTNYGYTREQMDRINDLAYFGYGYGNHTDEKWISITQMLIWKTVDKTSTFEWIDNFSDRNPINPYQNEINEIERLISDKNKKPSFANGNAVVVYNHSELNDTNNVLSKYRIKETKGVSVSINGNKLVIDRITGTDEGEITLIKDGSSAPGKFFYSNTSQNILIRGGSSSVEVKVKIKVQKGNITIKKVDEELNANESQGESNLNGAVFELYDYSDNKLGETTLNEDGIGSFNDLYMGKYKVREKTPGKGYKLDENIYDIELGNEHTDYELVVANKVIKSKLKILKLYGSKKDLDNNTMSKEQGVSFEIYDSSDELVDTITTDEEGLCEITLPYGTYKIVQKNTTENYEKVEDRIITIDENSEEIIELTLNDVEVEVPNAWIVSINEELFKICRTSLLESLN